MTSPPKIVVYCHCSDCRRWTGGPVAAFAAFADADLVTSPALGPAFTAFAGVDRWTCDACGSPLAARFDYLPGQTYVPIGVIDQAADLAPQLHCHAASGLPWLCIDDTLPRSAESGRDSLNSAAAVRAMEG